jgi:hypothetical protein
MKFLTPLALIAVLACALACAETPYGSPDMADIPISESPLGGEALVQRKQDMDQAFRDLWSLNATMSSLIDRRDSGSIGLLDAFLASYFGRHLDPMLRSHWPSRHPELSAIDASLRFAKAELLIQMRYPRQVQAVIDDIEQRFEGRDSLLVDYPLGERGTLGKALEILEDRKWRG